MQLKYHMVTIEDLVPKDHFLRKLEQALDLSFVYGETAHLYSRKYGRPPIDPVVMVKYLLLGFLYGIPSERQIEQRCADSNAFRWYLGIDLDERVPDHSTVSQLRRKTRFPQGPSAAVRKGCTAVRGSGTGERPSGGDGLHPREGQRLPGLRISGGDAGGGGELLGTAGRL